MNKIITSFLSIAAVFVFAASAYAATTVVVTGNTAAGENQPGWMFNRDITTSTPFEFNADEASVGLGSLYVEPITNTNTSGLAPNPNWDKFIGENFINTLVADVNSISYDFMIGPNSLDTQEEHFYMSVYANFGESDDLKFYDCRYSVVPATGSTTDWTTVTFDPTQTYPVATRTGTQASPHACPTVPANMDLLSEGSNIRAFSLNVGDTSASDTGLDGYFDNVVVDTTADVVTYDFEPVLSPVTKDGCKKGGWMNFNTPVFENQGQCVSFVEANVHAGK